MEIWAGFPNLMLQPRDWNELLNLHSSPVGKSRGSLHCWALREIKRMMDRARVFGGDNGTRVKGTLGDLEQVHAAASLTRELCTFQAGALSSRGLAPPPLLHFPAPGTPRSGPSHGDPAASVL